MMRGGRFKFLTLAFLCGLTSSLYLRTPLGTLPMLDLASFVLAVPLFLTNYSRYPKHFKWLLGLCALWLLNAMISDFWRMHAIFVYLKAYLIVINSFTLLVVGEWVVRQSYSALPVFLAGNAISSVISLYYFQNGALLSFAYDAGFAGGTDMSSFLQEKQVYPIWMSMFLMSGMMLLRRLVKVPWFVCVGAFFVGAVLVLMHGGSRSTFLIMAGTGGLTLIFAYRPKWINFFFKRKMVTLVCLVVAAVVFRAIYFSMAKSGMLGDSGLAKYEEKVAGEDLFMDDRADLLIDWPFLWRSPLIGAGSAMWDRWHYVDRSPYVPHVHPVSGRPIYYDHFFGHSAIVFAWCAHGVFGLFFWLYILWLLFEFLNDRLRALGDYAPFIVFGTVGLVWDILFSPYGGFRGQAMFMAAFVALSKAPQFYQWVEMSRRGLCGEFRPRLKMFRRGRV